jgi:chromosome partitioning protein
MGRVISITNQKGGVGKTTTTINLAASLATHGKKILMLDLDPQGNATMGSGVDKYNLEQSSYDVLLGDTPLAEAVVRSDKSGFDVLPSNADLTAAEVGLMNLPMREKRLSLALSPARARYDYILIDCPPSLNMLTLNALVASDGVIIPLQCEYYALEGLTSLLDTIRQIQESRNADLEIEGILRTMHDPRNNLSNDVSTQLISHFNELVFRTVIPRNVRIAEAPSHGLPVMAYDKSSRGAISYLALAGEFLRRSERRSTTAV